MLRLTMQTQLARSGRSLRRGSTAGWRWSRISGERSLRLYRRVVRACVGVENRRPFRIAMRSALRPAGLKRTLLQRRGTPAAWLRRSRAGKTKATGAGFAPGERSTLELGSCIVLSALGLGMQFGRWPVWSALVAVGGYLTWVVIYSEATVQARRRWALPRHPASAALGSEETASSPPQEQIPT
jgi:hypothetical protein